MVQTRLGDEQDTDWTLVATSCVEAGVDLSFRTGMREQGSLSSLLQTAGRVNRNGRFEDAAVWSFRIEPGRLLREHPGLRESAVILRRYLELGRDIAPGLCTEAIRTEIRQYGRAHQGDRLLACEAENRFPEVERRFQVIDSDACPAVVDGDLAKRVAHGETDWREIQRNTVQISRRLLREHRVPKLLDELYNWTLGYDNFLGYMAGVLPPEETDH